MGKWSTLLETSLADLVPHFAAWQFLCFNEVGKMMSSCSPIYWDMDEESLLVMARHLEYFCGIFMSGRLRPSGRRLFKLFIFSGLNCLGIMLILFFIEG